MTTILPRRFFRTPQRQRRRKRRDVDDGHDDDDSLIWQGWLIIGIAWIEMTTWQKWHPESKRKKTNHLKRRAKIDTGFCSNQWTKENVAHHIVLSSTRRVRDNVIGLRDSFRTRTRKGEMEMFRRERWTLAPSSFLSRIPSMAFVGLASWLDSW